MTDAEILVELAELHKRMARRQERIAELETVLEELQ